MANFRQETGSVLTEMEGMDTVQPLITICPMNVDYFLSTARGFDKLETNFRKYFLMQQQSFLLKDYNYKG